MRLIKQYRLGVNKTDTDETIAVIIIKITTITVAVNNKQY